MKGHEATGANSVALGWLEHGNRKDATEYVKGYAHKHFEAPALCWFSVLPFMGGWLFEVQEGGPGRSHLPAAAKSLTAGGAPGWVRVGRRAYSVSMRDGRPFCVLLPESQSQELLNDENQEGKLVPKGKMERVVKRGTAMLVTGTSIMIAGALFFAGSAGFHALSQRYVPENRTIDSSLLPHRQWSRVEAIPPNLFVETLKVDPEGTQWQAVVKPIRQPSGSSNPDSGQTDEIIPLDGEPTENTAIDGVDEPVAVDLVPIPDPQSVDAEVDANIDEPVTPETVEPDPLAPPAPIDVIEDQP